MSTQVSSSPLIRRGLLPSIGSTKTRSLRPKHAQALIDGADFSAQRSLRSSRVKEMTALMNEGKWSSGASTGIRFVVSLESGTLYNVDGQHTLHAIANADESVEIDMRLDEVSNREQVAAEYSKHDRNLSRSSKDSIVAYDLQSEFPLTLTDLGHVSAAVNHIRGDLRYSDKSLTLRMDEHINEIREWAPYMIPFKSCIAGSPGDMRSNMIRKPVLAPALVTMRYQRGAAEKFWRGVAWPEGNFYDPRRTLRRFLEKYNLKGGGDTLGQQISKQKMTRAVERAWVYFYEDRGDLRVIQAGNENRELRFVGTPFHPDS